MRLVIFRRYPLEVVGAIVGFIAVYMVHFRGFGVRLFAERLRYDSMNVYLNLFVVTVESETFT